MHKNFSEWYSSFEIQRDPDRLNLRWTGLDDYLAKSGPAEVETLLRLAFSLPKIPPTRESVVEFRSAFKRADDSFPEANNDRELQVLAGAGLASLLEADGPLSAYAALATATAFVGGGRVANLPMDLAGISEHAIGRISEKNSRRPQLVDFRPPEIPKWDLTVAGLKLTDSAPETLAAALNTVSGLFRRALEKTNTHQTTVLGAVTKFATVQDEELQMLWWLVGERSVSLNLPFAQLNSDAKPVILGAELAGFVAQLPGPPSVRSMLSRSGISDTKKVGITDGLNSAPESWLAASKFEASPLTQPMHFAISRLLETGPGDEWIPGWAKISGIAQDFRASKLAIGELFFRERLQLTSVG